ncbi:MAG: tetratricopeptide repeat protein [Asgard group archaeon]|nr:tetratricopeptide repeat protein [Asgard group archaeon]
MDEIDRLEETPDISDSSLVELALSKSRIYTQLGFFEKSIILSQQILNNFEEKFLSLEQKCDFYCYIIESLWQQGRFEDSLLIIEKAEYLATKEINDPNSLSSKEITAKILFQKGSVFCFVDLVKSLEYLNECLILSKITKNDDLYAQCLYRKGKILTFKGSLQESMLLLEQSLVKGRALNNSIIVAKCNVAIGEIYRLKGDFGKALQFYNTALIYHQELGNIYGMAITYNNVGIVYYSKGDLDNALEYFSKSLARSLEINFKFTVVESSYYLINILSNKNQFAEAEKYLELSKKTSKEHSGTMIFYYSILSEAILLRKINRFYSLGRAQEILQSIIERNLVYQEINVHAMLNLCEILLHELRFTDNRTILSDLEELTNKILKIAQQQFSKSLLAEVYWLKGRLALLDTDIGKASGFLSQAQAIAEGQDLENLARRISNDHDNLLSEVNKWKNLIEENVSLADRIKESKIDNLVLNMINRATFELDEIENDIPVMLIILNENGIPLFSMQFGDDTKVDQVLLSGFLSAINNIVQEIFATEGLIRRIEHQNYLLIFQNIENIIVCYAFKGSSYSARKKVETFASKLVSSSFMQYFGHTILTGRYLEKEKSDIMEKWAQEIFS